MNKTQLAISHEQIAIHRQLAISNSAAAQLNSQSPIATVSFMANRQLLTGVQQ